MCLMNVTRINSTYSLVDEHQRHNKSKLKCVWGGGGGVNTSPIISLKAEDKLEIIRRKVKNIRKRFVKLR